jgi:hypothetical protein
VPFDQLLSHADQTLFKSLLHRSESESEIPTGNAIVLPPNPCRKQEAMELRRSRGVSPAAMLSSAGPAEWLVHDGKNTSIEPPRFTWPLITLPSDRQIPHPRILGRRPISPRD